MPSASIFKAIREQSTKAKGEGRSRTQSSKNYEMNFQRNENRRQGRLKKEVRAWWVGKEVSRIRREATHLKRSSPQPVGGESEGGGRERRFFAGQESIKKKRNEEK